MSDLKIITLLSSFIFLINHFKKSTTDGRFIGYNERIKQQYRLPVLRLLFSLKAIKLVPKIKKTLSQRKKEALFKKRETELESLCRQCGLCCHVKVGLSDGSYIIHPLVTCKYLTPDNRCSVYERRFLCSDSVCFSQEKMINTDYLLPEGCPYTALRKGYKPARIVTQAEFDDIVLHELEVGNYNILLVDRAF